MGKRQLAPSLLAANFNRLGEELKLIESAGIKMLHIDVMDGEFVPSISMGMPVIASIRKESSLFFDVHLMVNKPERYIDDFIKAGADSITVHAEACMHLQRTVTQIREKGKKACVALNPATPLNSLDYILEDLDMVLLMTVNPGYGGQAYIPVMTRKIRRLKEKMEEENISIPIEVDGGIKLSNVQEVMDAGADILVAGSSVFGTDTKNQINRFFEKLRECK